MTTDPNPTPGADPAAGIQSDVTALGEALDSIQQHVANLESQIQANPGAPVSSLDLSALKSSLDQLVGHAQAISAQSSGAAAPSGSGAAPDPPAPTGPSPDPGTTVAGGGSPQ